MAEGDADAPVASAAENTGHLVVRELDPFAYWPHYASALPGFGGAERPHEPKYCFCTPYIDPLPGHCSFLVQMRGVKVTDGEIALRVHALRQGNPPDIQLATTGYIRLDQVVGDTIDYEVSFAALEGLQYCCYGLFSAPSDLVATSISVMLQESTDPVPVAANLGQEMPSRLAKADHATSHRLVAPIAPSLALPLSQALVIDESEWRKAGIQWPRLAEQQSDALRLGEAIVVMRALNLSGAELAGSRGLIVDPPFSAVIDELVQGQAHVHRLIRPDDGDGDGDGDGDDAVDAGDYGRDRDAAFDFVVSHAMAYAGPSPEDRLQVIGAGLRTLRGGGIGIFLMPFWTGTAHQPSPSPEYLDRNAVQQIALRLIGQRYSVSQLAFPPASKAGGEVTSFILIVHKLA